MQKPFPIVTDARVPAGNSRRPDDWWQIWNHLGTYKSMEHLVEVKTGFQWKVKCQETCGGDTWEVDGGWQEWMNFWVPIYTPAIPHPGGYYAFLGRTSYSLLVKPATSMAMEVATQSANLFELGNAPTTICKSIARPTGPR